VRRERERDEAGAEAAMEAVDRACLRPQDERYVYGSFAAQLGLVAYGVPMLLFKAPPPPLLSPLPPPPSLSLNALPLPPSLPFV
jgi:hypothetical protein